jgi:hypothetical protein
MKTCESRRAVPAASTCRMNRNGKERGVVARHVHRAALIRLAAAGDQGNKPDH